MFIDKIRPCQLIHKIKTANCSKSQFQQQVMSPDAFIIKMSGYGRKQSWGKKMVYFVKKISKKVTDNKLFKDILESVESKVHIINLLHYKSIIHSMPYGNRRTELADFGCTPGFLISPLGGRGHEYYDRYKTLCDKNQGMFECKSNKNYSSANTAKIFQYKDEYTDDDIAISYGFNALKEWPKNDYRSNNLFLAEQAYNHLKSISKPTKQEVVNTAATIQWLIAQEVPYIAGSDSIATMLSRSLMHSYGCTISPLKEGLSCDFEAFCTNLDDYIKNYPTFFEINPTL